MSLRDPVTMPTRRVDPLDPPPELARYREHEPIRRLRYPDGHIGWLVTSHELARAVLGDTRFSMKPIGRMPVAHEAREAAFDKLEAEDHPRLRSRYAGNFLGMDPPDHTRLRRMVAGEFTVRRMKELADHVEEIVDRHIDAITAAGPPADLVAAYAMPIPSLMICELLGVPYDQREGFQHFGEAIEEPDAGPDEIGAAYVEFGDLMRRVVARQREDPGEGVLGRLAAAGELDDAELSGVGMLLTAAGHHTVKNMLALSIYTLLADRTRWEQLRADPELVPNAVEELLRYLTTFKLGAFTRTATEDIAVGGVVVQEGESVTVSFSAANRDPARFPDPDTVDPTRNASGHLAFGHGIHMCLGQHLARIELQAGISGLLRRLPGLRLAVPADQVPMHPDDLGQAGPYELMVTW